MKVLAILGSPHGGGGSTGKLLEEVLKAVRQAGAEATTMLLSSMPVEPCRGCDLCHKTGNCAINDHFEVYKQALKEADGVILASPNYIFSVTAQTKALLDRCSPLLHCQLLRGKYAAAVVTSGGDASGEVEAYLLRFLRALGCQTVGSVGASGMQLADPSARIERFRAAAELGGALVGGISERKVYPEQTQELAAFGQWMKQLVTARKSDWPFEYEYWQGH